MVRLRLKRMGKKKQPTYRLVAIDKRAPRDGRFIESLGHYNPRTEPATIVFEEERILDWLKKGASPSATVQRLLKQSGIWQKYSGSESPEPVTDSEGETKVEAES